MKKFVTINTIILTVLLSAIAIQFTSCGEDEPEVLDREKFLGDYVGSFNCGGLLSVISSDSLAFSISESADPANEDGVILNLTVDMNVIALAGVIASDTLTVMDMLEGITVDVPNLGSITGDITGTGLAILTGANLNGDINLSLDAPVLGPLGPLQGTCVLDGVRQ